MTKKINNTKLKLTLIALLILVISLITFFSMHHFKSKSVDKKMVPQLMESEILKNELGNIKKAYKSLFEQKYDNGRLYTLNYNIVTTDNKKHVVRLLFNKDDELKIIGYEINEERFYIEEKEVEIDDDIPDNAYKIEDLRIEKTSLVGKYVSVDNPDIYFEIFEDYATIHENFELDMELDARDKKHMEIEYYDDALRLSFQVNRHSVTADFYSTKTDTFIWIDYLATIYDPEYVFKKQK